MSVYLYLQCSKLHAHTITYALHRVNRHAHTRARICILKMRYSKSLCDFIFSFRLIGSTSCAVRRGMTVKSSVACITLPNVFAQGYMITTFTELNAIHITQIILFQPHTHEHVSHLNGSPCAQRKRKQFMAILMCVFSFDGRRRRHQHHHRLRRQQPSHENRK